MTKDQLRLAELHHQLIDAQIDLLIENGIYDTRDNSYLRLHDLEKEKYLKLQESIKSVQKDILRLALGEYEESPSIKTRFKTEVIRHFN